MPAFLLPLLQWLVPVVIEQGPKVVTAVRELFKDDGPAKEDWERLRQYAPPYESYGIKES